MLYQFSSVQTSLSKSLLLSCAGLMTIVTLGLPVAALAKEGDVIREGTCSAQSTWELKLSPEDRGIEVEFEVDQDFAGQRWDVTILYNKKQIFAGQRTTQPPSGSFTVRKVVANRAGKDVFVATAKNARTGEICRGRASGTF